MFNSLPKYLKDNGLQGDVRTLLFLKKGIERGLVHTLGDLYLLLKGLVTNSPKDFGPFTTAFYQYFLDITIKKGESLDNAIARSEAFKNWRNNNETTEELTRELNHEEIKELVNDFINDVHFTSFDIQNRMKGEDILQNDDPNRADTEGSDDAPNEVIKRMADYNNISVEELLERMKQVAAQQKRRHSGGSHWIGTGGNSPYGHNGAGDGGVRVGGSGGGKMARAVLEDRNYFPVDTQKILNDDTVDVALAFLKGIEDQSVEQYLDIPMTITEGVKNGGVFLPYEKEKVDTKVQVMLLIDNGGWSMSPYVDAVTKLFSKMKRRFAHDLKTYYFHNTVYGEVYKDEFRSYSQLERIDALCKLDKNYAVFIIGDADMGPYELTPNSIQSWQRIKDHFERIIWLNPTEQKYWTNSNTIIKLSEQFEMFPLSPFGIEKGVEAMNKKRRFNKAF